MVRPGLRSRSKTRVVKRTPGGKLKTHYVRNKTQVKLVMCINCGKKVSGTSITSNTKTKKRPSRKYPELCTACARKKIKEEARKM